jgi:hypothetical protein
MIYYAGYVPGVAVLNRQGPPTEAAWKAVVWNRVVSSKRPLGTLGFQKTQYCKAPVSIKQDAPKAMMMVEVSPSS